MDLSLCVYPHNGMNQDTRMLFKMLSQDSDIQVTGLVYSRHSRSMNEKLYWGKSRSQQLVAQARHLSSMIAPLPSVNGVDRIFQKMREYLGLINLSSRFPIQQLQKEQLFNLIWRQFLCHSYEPGDYQLFEQNNYVLSDLNAAGYAWRLHNKYPEPRLETSGYDVMIFPDVTPVRVSAGTKKMVRYHDMIPLKLPDTLQNHFHITYHHRALTSCLKNSFFTCVSQATLNDMESVYGVQKDRARVIPCSVSPSYYREENPKVLAEIILNRSCPLNSFRKQSSENQIANQNDARPYLLAVSTIVGFYFFCYAAIGKKRSSDSDERCRP
jgi:hypothetical protein